MAMPLTQLIFIHQERFEKPVLLGNSVVAKQKMMELWWDSVSLSTLSGNLVTAQPG